MSDKDTRGGGAPDDEDPETGTPVAELRELERPPSEGFMARLRRRLERRALTSQVASLSWSGVWAVLLELLTFVFESLGSGKNPKGGRK